MNTGTYITTEIGSAAGFGHNCFSTTPVQNPSYCIKNSDGKFLTKMNSFEEFGDLTLSVKEGEVAWLKEQFDKEGEYVVTVEPYQQ